MHRLWKVQSSSSRCPFSFSFSAPNGPRQEVHESQSAAIDIRPLTIGAWGDHPEMDVIFK